MRGIALVLMVACGGVSRPDEPVEDVQEVAQQPPVEPSVEPSAEPEPLVVENPLVGRYRIVLSAEDRKQLEIVRLVFRDPPPTSEDFEEAHLSEGEVQLAATLLAVRSQRADSARLEEMRRALEALEETRLTITGEALETEVAGIISRVPYRILQQSEGRYELEVTRDGVVGPALLTLMDEELTYAEGGGKTVVFRRSGVE